MNKDMSKRFDDRFELESQGCSECGGYELIDKTEKRYPKGKYYCEYDLEKIKSFIQSEIDLAVAEDRKRIVLALEKIKKEVQRDHDGYPLIKSLENVGYNACLLDIIQLTNK